MAGLIRLIVFAALVFVAVKALRNILIQLTRSSPWAPPNGSGPSSGRGDDRRGQSRDPHEVLGVSSQASASEIRDAYQRLVRQYHPDRVADLGPELREVAEAKTKELNAAYAKLRVR
jgi:DnaJ-domain-containing protein 1